MPRLHIRNKFIIVLLVIVVVSFSVNCICIANNNLSSISGRVVDRDGEPIPDLTLAVKPIEIKDRWEIGPRKPNSIWKKAVTDKEGLFSIANIDSGSSRIVVYPELGSGFGISSLKFDDITVYSTAFRRQSPTWFGKPTISIEPGAHLENVVVTVKKAPMHISGRVLLSDGSPLSNTEIYLTTLRRKRRTKFFVLSSGGSGGATSRNVMTDAEGYFATYTPEDESEYAVKVEYQGITAKSRWFHLKRGQSKQNLILRLRGLEKHRLNLTKRAEARKAMWFVNPDNHHAYKKIECESWDDALTKAKAENAYLVEVNDAAEQKWIESLFKESLFYWIGMSIPIKGKPWQWNSGEPVNYVNWGPSGTPDVNSASNKKIPVALIPSTKKWIALDSTNPIRTIVKHAILEKNAF